MVSALTARSPSSSTTSLASDRPAGLSNLSTAKRSSHWPLTSIGGSEPHRPQGLFDAPEGRLGSVPRRRVAVEPGAEARRTSAISRTRSPSTSPASRTARRLPDADSAASTSSVFMRLRRSRRSTTTVVTLGSASSRRSLVRVRLMSSRTRPRPVGPCGRPLPPVLAAKPPAGPGWARWSSGDPGAGSRAPLRGTGSSTRIMRALTWHAGSESTLPSRAVGGLRAHTLRTGPVAPFSLSRPGSQSSSAWARASKAARSAFASGRR